MNRKMEHFASWLTTGLMLLCLSHAAVATADMELPVGLFQVGTGASVPDPVSGNWKPVAAAGLDMASLPSGESFWIRVPKEGSAVAWSVYGPLQVDDIISVKSTPNAAPYGIGVIGGPSSEKDSVNKGFGPRITVGSSRTRIGPVKLDTPKIPAPKISITIGSSGSTSSPGTTSAPGLKAGLEPDPVRNPSDPQEAFCQAPVRAFNRESYPVTVRWLERRDATGAQGCTGQGISTQSLDLAAGGSARVFCSVVTSPSNACRITKQGYQVTAVRR